MGNYCSSAQNKKDKDNASEKSEESPSYQLADKNNKKSNNDIKGAPLADPEPISDVSTTTGQNTSPIDTNANGQSQQIKSIGAKPLSNIQTSALSSVGDSVTNSPLTSTPPCDLPTSNVTSMFNLPSSLTPLYGRLTTSRRLEKDKKIVLIILSAETLTNCEQTTLHKIYENLRKNCDSKGYELFLSNLHCKGSSNENNSTTDVKTWIDGPLEAQGGHDIAALSLAEISRHSQTAYLIPMLFLGGSLGPPLLPLTIESQDFCSALNVAEADNIHGKELLNKWYILDNKAQPSCYRLKTKDQMIKDTPDENNKELLQLLLIFVEIFSKELRDSYLSTVVEQEINNTVLMSQELSKRCIWIQNGNYPIKIAENSDKLETEMYRRLSNIHNELKTQLSDKHIIRNQINVQITPENFQNQLEQTISTEIDSIIDEHSTKYSIPYCTFGVDRRILVELEEVNRYSRILGQNCANFTIMENIKNYVSGTSTAPLIIFGKPGCGKSVLSAKIAQNIHTWMPDCGFILRYVGLTPYSSDLVSLLGQICNQISIIMTGSSVQGPHTFDFYSTLIKSNLETTKNQIIILLDSLDNAEIDNIDWIPTILQENVKIIITLTSMVNDVTLCESSENGSRGDFIINKLRKIESNKISFIQLTQFSQEQWNDVLNFGGGDIYAANGALQLPDLWKNVNEKVPIQAKLLWWLAWLGVNDLNEITINSLCDKIFDILEYKFDKNLVKFIFSILIASREGVNESEMVALLNQTDFAKDNASELWIKFCWIMGPLLMHNKNINLMDSVVKSAGVKRYQNDVVLRHKDLKQFYSDQVDVFTDNKGKDKCYNSRKYIELPYHVYQLDKSLFATSIYLSDLKWIYNKLESTGCVHLLKDIQLSSSLSLSSSSLSEKHINLLNKFLEIHFKSLNYDSKQLYSLLSEFLYNEEIKDSEILTKWKEHITSIKESYLERVNIPRSDHQVEENNENIKYDLVANLPGKGYFVISVSTDREEICVWNAAKETKIRTLKGVPSPSSVCPIGDYGIAVLCKREIKVIDLNEGKFTVTLKGVMNQKMPYFGLHDPKHIVCLSRNRMYVNLMHLETGDCVTTFKAGEDRFLNSLLVSGDGRILVCGDETQKPFPLLVWHLSQRKLLYDLRIPHHDFITQLSAITHEGSYVCVVAKELNEPAPNFIVVYDLQSGTLFKKWKPSCNTVSLAISQSNACVIAGLEDARILIWDLVTGNCKCTLVGHNAPVTMLKLDPQGKTLLSGDKEARDMSIRLWDIDTGSQMAVYTPTVKITTCEILPNGKYVILGLENHKNLMTLKLKGGAVSGDDNEENEIYGKQENEGKVFDV